MGKGTNIKEYEDHYHIADYNDEGRHSYNLDPKTGDITGDHSVSNENQDYKEQWPDSNIWDDLESDENLS